MTNNEQATKDGVFSSMMENFLDRFPNRDVFYRMADYVAAVDEEGGDVNELRTEAVTDLEAMKEEWDSVKEQIDDLLKFAKENFKK